jgi:hypothetical protein
VRNFFTSYPVADGVGSLCLWGLVGWVVWENRAPTQINSFYIFILGLPTALVASFLGARSLYAIRKQWVQFNWLTRLIGILAFLPFGIFFLCLIGTIPYLMLKDWLQAHF